MTEGQGALLWRKSSHSGPGEDSDCCEVALLAGEVRVRDSWRPDAEVLSFTPDVWRPTLAALIAGWTHE
ncbi:DUF397 domain-containing protein [Streptomyces sp. NPDC093085]|uniref:DUF397 domain-containing protein n=1 Tax=Streptomyces sp. NPDC093085 TaxID=3155068 RepID=UPI0034150DDE